MKTETEIAREMMNEPTTIININRTERPNTYEVGKPSNRFKIHFENADDLTKQIDLLRKSNFIIEGDMEE